MSKDDFSSHHTVLQVNHSFTFSEYLTGSAESGNLDYISEVYPSWAEEDYRKKSFRVNIKRPPETKGSMQSVSNVAFLSMSGNAEPSTAHDPTRKCLNQSTQQTMISVKAQQRSLFTGTTMPCFLTVHLNSQTQMVQHTELMLRDEADLKSFEPFELNCDRIGFSAE